MKVLLLNNSRALTVALRMTSQSKKGEIYIHYGGGDKNPLFIFILIENNILRVKEKKNTLTELPLSL